MRRTGTAVAALLSAAFFLAGCKPGAPADASGMNLLVITLDTTRADALGLYGNRDATTPEIDRLGRAGLVFEQCYTPAPLTLPAHCSLFTGRYPVAHGVRNNGTYVLPDSERTLAKVFRESGYETAAVVASFTVAAKFGLAQGFDTYDEDFESGRVILNYTAEIPADRVYGKFADWLGRRSGRKFFAWVHFYDAHSPYIPHGPAAANASPWTLYEGEVRYVDAHVGKIVQALRDKGLYESTVIVIVGDHGEAFCEHKERGHGIFCYEESLRVPLVLHNPKLFREPKLVAGRVRLVDVMPSLLELFRMKAPADIQGRSFWPLAEGREKGRREVYFESLFGREEFNWAPLSGLIDGPRKYISLPEPELYDLEADPGETRNLFPGEQASARTIDAKLADFVRGAAAESRGAGRRELSPADVERLRALGYVSGFSSKSAGGTDPKRAIDVYLEVADLKELLKKGDDRKGEERLAEVLARHPGLELPDIFEIRYEMLKKKGRLAEAIDVMRQAMVKFPEQESFKVLLAMDLIASGRTAEARDFCRGLVAADDRMTAAHVLLGNAEDLLGEPDAALASYERAAALEPQNGAVRAKIAREWLLKGEPARAQAILEELEGRKAVVDSPEFMDAMAGLGQALLAAGQTDRALDLYRKAADATPESPAVWLNLGSVYFARKDYDRAMEYFEKSVALDGNFALGHSNIGFVHLSRMIASGDRALAGRALAEFDRALALDPRQAPAWSGRASVRVALGQAADAVADYEQALRLDPNLFDTYINLSVALRELGRYAEAVKYLDMCKERLYSRLGPREREDFDRLYAEVKALKGGN